MENKSSLKKEKVSKAMFQKNSLGFYVTTSVFVATAIALIVSLEIPKYILAVIVVATLAAGFIILGLRSAIYLELSKTHFVAVLKQFYFFLIMISIVSLKLIIFFSLSEFNLILAIILALAFYLISSLLVIIKLKAWNKLVALPAKTF